MSGDVPQLVLTEVRRVYAVRDRTGRHHVTAVDGVSFSVAPGAAVGLVGASGSGKSTLARIITGTDRPTSGTVQFGATAVHGLRGGDLRRYHRQVQMVFQDPYGALNPLHTVEYAVARPCRNFLRMSAAATRARVHELLETVGLTPTAQFAGKLPHQLSGGQRQRVVIARALACDPGLIVADEPVSMLDVSMRAGVLGLLSALRAQRGISLVYITHDLLSARVVTDEILVLNQGRVVEYGPTRQVMQQPQHPYTVQLLDAVPAFAASRPMRREDT
ncbi:MAG TPA: ATP-binding cassette domain-containing protein [Micromonosporaceae bacterium]|jgi:peptide/nickel transport system ATP-binding protein